MLTKNNILCFSLIIVFGLLARTANAENLYLAGVSANDEGDYYAYIGSIIPILDSSLDSDGTLLKLWVNNSEFEYQGTLAGGAGGIPTKFQGEGPGAEIAIGHRRTLTSKITSTTYIGLVWRDIDVSPNDPGTDVDDENAAIKLQQEFNVNLTNNFDISLMGSYNIGFDSYWSRLRPGYTFANGWKLGPEVIFLGGDVYDKQRYGVFLNGMSLGKLNLGLSLGNEEEASSSESSAYGSLSFSMVY